LLNHGASTALAFAVRACASEESEEEVALEEEVLEEEVLEEEA
jgi:hypothetical protein